MSYKILITIFSLLQSVTLIAQTNTTISSGETGNTLLSSIRSNYTPSTLGYDTARDTLYKVIDKQPDDSLECIYSGFKILLDTGVGVDPSTDAFNKGINCEHSWPQSKGASDEPQKSNMHNLFPCKSNVNSSRSNNPFADITDSYTDNWYKRSSTLNSIPSSNIDDYAEKENDFEPATFEPRESVKGDIARAVFYFYAIYESAANDTFWNQMKDDLRTWHYADPVTVAEQTRSNAIAGYQNDKYNPFCFDSTLARRAWFSSSSSLALANETFYPYCSSVENSGSNPSNWSASGFSVSTTSPNTSTYSYRANAGTSYDFIYSPSFDLSDVTSGNGKMVFWVRTTASVFSDFGEMTVYADLGDDGVYETAVQTYSDNTSFSSGSYAKLTITLPDAVLGQYNVRFRFAFNRSTGNGGNWNFDDFSIINTASSVLFINEIDYNDPSTDDEEFIELCGLAGNYTDVTLKLINGSNGLVYGTIELGYIIISNETEGYGYYVWAPTNTIVTTNVDLSSNGSGASSIQNGSDDGVQVDIGGVIIDAVSYEDSGTPLNDTDGNAMEQTNFAGALEDDANTTISRQGLDGSSWELQTRTIGAVNSDQSLPVELTSFTADNSRAGEITLNWVTESEIENLGFLLDRRPETGEWTEIASYITDEALRGQGSVTYRTEYSFTDKTVEPGVTYDYRLADVSYAGEKVYHALNVLGVAVTEIPEEFALFPAYPNPFNPETVIRYQLSADSDVSLQIYDVKGQMIETLLNKTQDPGFYKVNWKPNNLPSGVYFCKLTIGDRASTQKLILLK